MVDVTTNVDMPIVGWECRNCGEPYNSRMIPDKQFCGACRSETIWELPDERKTEYSHRLMQSSAGHELLIVPELGAPIVGTVSRTFGTDLLLDKEDDPRVVDADTLTLYTVDEYRNGVPGDDIHYVERQ